MLNRDEELFRQTLSKDETPPGRISRNGLFVKTLPDERTAQTEFTVLTMLQEQRVAPEPVFIAGTTIAMELVEGMRVFELLTVLHAMRDEIDEQCVRAFFDRLRARLSVLQESLTDGCDRWPVDTYPFDVKIVSLIGLLSRVLNVPEPDTREWDQWHDLAAIWEQTVDVPFRDATPKNMILADPRLAVGQPADVRRHTLARLLRDNPDYLLQVPVIDIDFSSSVHLTSWEDDWISMLMHESSARWNPDPRALLPRASEPLRWNLSVLVRYLRFGGRKMAYNLLHPVAAAIRFAHDDAGFYLRALPGLMDAGAPGFAADFDLVMRRINMLSAAFDAAVRPTAAIDPWGARPLWRESPLELS